MAAIKDDETLARSFEEYREPIWRHVTTLVRDPVEAEDITQETFARAYSKLETLQDESKLSAWLYRIATNISYDRFRKLSRQPTHRSLDSAGEEKDREGSIVPIDESSPRLDVLMEQAEMSTCVREYLEDLPDSYRAVILLHDIEGLTNAEIAEMLSCSVETAKIRLHRARKKLRAALASGCEFSKDDRGVFVCEPKPARDSTGTD